MPNPILSREKVHAWSEEIGEQSEHHQPALGRLLRDQKRLQRFLTENAEHTGPATAGVAIYLFGVIARIFDLAGGRLRGATWAQVREAEKRVGGWAREILPFDEGFAERMRALEGRAQPHIVDEAYMALFERNQRKDEEVELDPTESLKVFFLLWVATEVLDHNWRPPKGFEGEPSYTYVHIEPSEDD